ncbi:MAG: O-methyltransferase [Bacteriovoracales bacterium]|jgi:caffeoyl-CoA O-methyltransferase
MKFVDEKIEDYCVLKSSRPSKYADEIESYTKKNVSHSQMLTGKMEASVLGFLIRSIKAKRVLEIGTYTGYSALCMAENLPKSGVVYTLDINEATTELAKSFWAKSPHRKKIKPLLGPAKETLLKIKGKFDFIFIDADKPNYLEYFKISLKMLTKGGVIAIDNVLWSGKVLEPNDNQTKAICELNDFISEKNGFYKTMLPVRDGIFLVRKLS